MLSDCIFIAHLIKAFASMESFHPLTVHLRSRTPTSILTSSWNIQSSRFFFSLQKANFQQYPKLNSLQCFLLQQNLESLQSTRKILKQVTPSKEKKEFHHHDSSPQAIHASFGGQGQYSRPGFNFRNLLQGESLEAMGKPHSVSSRSLSRHSCSFSFDILHSFHLANHNKSKDI